MAVSGRGSAALATRRRKVLATLFCCLVAVDLGLWALALAASEPDAVAEGCGGEEKVGRQFVAPAARGVLRATGAAEKGRPRQHAPWVVTDVVAGAVVAGAHRGCAQACGAV